MILTEQTKKASSTLKSKRKTLKAVGVSVAPIVTHLGNFDLMNWTEFRVEGETPTRRAYHASFIYNDQYVYAHFIVIIVYMYMEDMI